MSEVIQFPESKIFVRLPVPPSVNRAWRNVPGKGRVKTAIYKTWRNDALMCAAAMCGGLRPFSCPVSVDIVIKRPRANADLDNFLKPTLDLLQAATLIDDDKNVHKLTVRWDDMADGCEVWIRPYVKPSTVEAVE